MTPDMTPFESQVNALVAGFFIPTGSGVDVDGNHVFLVDSRPVAQDDWREVARILSDRFPRAARHG